MATVTTALCNCGKVELEVGGAIIMTVACHCDDCQTAGKRLEQQSGAPRVLDAAGGTAYVMVRRNRVRCTRGAALLTAHKLAAGANTNRVVAGCCNAPMLVDFDRGPHWVSLYRDRIVGSEPPLEMRVQTKFAPKGTKMPDGVPAFPGVPLRMMARLLLAMVR